MIIEYYQTATKNIRTSTISKRLVKKFEQYLTQNQIPSQEWYQAIDTFMETQSYSKKTKYTYKNSLRNYIENIHFIKKGGQIRC